MTKLPRNKLDESVHGASWAVCNSDAYTLLPSSQIAPLLADNEVYLASELMFHRVLKSATQSRRRGRAHAPRHIPNPTSHWAGAPN
jgi:putative transposase